ncbi:hypothetical protein BT93_G2351 [Corymbia citriodora subsp. variegata]|nr:hypothetical protein BT93_G2351 [Corymbia citriodora subsp. variegata]
MATPAKLSRSLLGFTLLALLCLVEPSALGGGGFTADLIHRDSLSSPFRDPFATDSEFMHSAARRSISHAHRIWARLGSKIRYDLTSNGGGYYVKVWIGDPPLETFLLIDTGSDLLWTQCEPCINCYHQKPPIFVPGNSRTYRTVKRRTEVCDSLDRSWRGGDTGRDCTYYYTYMDKSFTKGDVAEETITIGTPPGAGAIPAVRMAFGCGHNNSGTFRDIGSGILGLAGSGPFSLISQMEGSIRGLFGYCLVTETGQGTSKISFGEDAVVSGPGAISTTLDTISPYYTVILEGFSVKNTRFSYGDNSADSEAESNKGVKMAIDSGATLTSMPSQYFSNLTRAVADAISLPKVPDPKGKHDLCFRTPEHIRAPVVTLHFAGGADMVLETVNMLAWLREDDLVCFTMKKTDKVPVLGRIAQLYFKVGFNRREMTVSFKHVMDCTAQHIDMI